tara:strand:- start:1216 stop:1458 length:243 start_codon:yes stop_codon:yes gene_type:complete
MKKSKDPISLKEYRDKYGIPLTTLAHRCGISFHKMYNIVRGGCPTLKTAVSIEKYTEGEVTCEKLLPEEMLEEIEKGIHQ